MKLDVFQASAECMHIYPSENSSNDPDPEPYDGAEEGANDQERDQRGALDAGVSQHARGLGAPRDGRALRRLDVDEVGDPLEGELGLVAKPALGLVVHEELVEGVAGELEVGGG